MKKSVGLLLCAAIAISCTSATVYAATTSANEAKATAEKQVPSGSNHLKTDTGSGKYEVSFYHEKQQERYEIEVSTATGKILSFESKLTDHRGGSTVTVTENAAKKKVTEEVPKAEILSVYLDLDDGYKTYEIRFRTDSYYGEYTIHPETGKILERDVRVGALPGAKDTAGLISQEKAAELALKEVPDSVMTDLDLDYENNSYVYELELYKNGNEYEVTLDAKTGKVLKNHYHKEDWYQDWSGPQTSNSYISLEKARQAALDRVPGAVVKECKLDFDDGRAIYEGELRQGNLEYEFEIDAVTGAFLKWEMDYDD